MLRLYYVYCGIASLVLLILRQSFFLDVFGYFRKEIPVENE